jgi:hypothetical protein
MNCFLTMRYQKLYQRAKTVRLYMQERFFMYLLFNLSLNPLWCIYEGVCFNQLI